MFKIFDYSQVAEVTSSNRVKPVALELAIMRSTLNVSMIVTACLIHPGCDKIVLQVNPEVSNSVWADPNLTRWSHNLGRVVLKGLMKFFRGFRL